MSALTAYPITTRWRPTRPERLQLYGAPTPNGVKVSILLEELALPYEPHLIDLSRNDSKDPAFLSLNPNGRIPAILDPQGPGGEPFALWESGAILVYLAEKAGCLLSPDPALRHETLQWLFFQMSGIGPMFGQFGYFHKHGGRDVTDRRPLERYLLEVRRLLRVLDVRLTGREWLAGPGEGTYSIADIATLGWVRTLEAGYDAGDLIGLEAFPHVTKWLARGLGRPAVVRGLQAWQGL